MITGPLTLYDTALHRFAAGSLRLPALRLTALLLNGTYVPDQAGHTVLADISPHEVTGGDYTRLQVTGVRVVAAPGAAQFMTDALNWGEPVNLPPVRYMVLVEGVATALGAASSLIGVVDLAPGGGAVESQRACFSLTPPASGWFEITALSAA
ncbi:hypothetical protein [Kordiimonas sp.]|uniref:hypothetical protein n=1 Tax=Kordiimonas sp. TaxID=1970157 RepID=UPI003A93CBE5